MSVAGVVTTRGPSMKLFRMTIWAVLFVTAAAGFAENLGRSSARERALRMRPSSAFSAFAD
jgi:hypothetical protein